MNVATKLEDVVTKNSVRQSGVIDGPPMLFAHGFGCSQNMWRLVAPQFERDYRVITFDHVGSGSSDLSAYDRGTYDSLHGYADDVIDIINALDLRDVIFVGHSVGAIIGVLAAAASPELFGKLVLVGPSPRYVNDREYVGGFERDDIDAMLDSVDRNYLGWSTAMAPAIMGNADRPELAEELSSSFCSTDPVIAQHFARVTFLSDNRADLAAVATPTLIVQSADDAIAPLSVGEFTRDAIDDSRLVVVPANGHCLHLSHPDHLVTAIRDFIA